MKNKNKCRDFPEHKCEFYKEECRKIHYELTNLVCQYDNLYANCSTHIFHRELAEKLVQYFRENKEKF